MKPKCILLVHGLTEYFHDKKYAERMSFRAQLNRKGYTTYEFDYRGRGNSKQKELFFSLKTATEDVDAMIKRICDVEKSKNVLIIGRGMAAYFILKSKQARQRSCPCIFWQPIFFPKRTMEKRGHLEAFQLAYTRSNDHEYVELEGIKLGKAFFESLSDASPEDVWDFAQFDVLYTQGDHVTCKEWIENFLSNVTSTRRQTVIRKYILDSTGPSQDHIHQSSMNLFASKTLTILK